MIKGTDYGSVGKHPRVASWQTQASDDPMFVGQWWKLWPAANIGVLAGGSGLVVLDVDPRHGGLDSLKALMDTHGVLPYGPRVQTGSGGLHFYFKHPGHPVGNSASAIAPGIDVKADSGYVVAPPSVHATGVSYKWDSDPEGNALDPWAVPLPALPLWLELLMETAGKMPDGRAAPVPNQISKGERRTHLLSLAGTMRHRNMGESAIFAALMAENDEKCQPPLDRTEVAKLSADAASWPPGEALVIIGPKTRGVKEYALPQPFNARDLQAMVIPPARWAVPGVLPEGLALLAGRPKLGKSWMTFNFGIAVAEGGIVLNEIPVEDGDVLILALEDTNRRLQSRMQRMMGSEPWPARLWLETTWPRLTEGGLEALDSWLGVHPLCRLVVVDTLARFKAPPAPGSKRGDIYAEDYAMGEGLQRLAGQHNVAIWAVTHYNKGIHEDPLNAVTGSTGLTGVVDTVVMLDRPRGSKGQSEATLRITGRDVEEVEYAVQFDGALGRWTILGDVVDAKASREAVELLQVLARIGHPCKAEDVAMAMGITQPAAKKRLYRAALNGLIDKQGGTYSLLADAPGFVKTPYSVIAVPSVPFSEKGTRGQRGQGTEGTENDRVESKLQYSEHETDHSGVDGSVTSPPKRGQGELSPPVPSVPFSAQPEPQTLNFERPAWLDGKVCPECREDHWTQRVGNTWACSACRPHLTVVRKEGV